MTKSLAIVQSNYIPWKGYFDLIDRVDEFILFDDVQYTRRDWRNRNKIKTPDGTQWLTIPVSVKGKYSQAIKDTQISDLNWVETHWKSIEHNYSRAPFFKEYAASIKSAYSEMSDEMLLSSVNAHFIKLLAQLLGIKTTISSSMDYEVIDGKTERLVSLCQQAGATHYLSGPAAKSYLDETQFEAVGMTVSYMGYEGYPEYPQLFPPFVHAVSVLDLIFNVGSRARDFMKAAS